MEFVVASCTVSISLLGQGPLSQTFGPFSYLTFCSRFASVSRTRCLPVIGHSGTEEETDSLVVQLVGTRAPESVVQMVGQLVVQ